MYENSVALRYLTHISQLYAKKYITHSIYYNSIIQVIHLKRKT
jgi:hypothetical protein